MYTILVACTEISDQAQAELKRAACPVHERRLWGDCADVKIVEIRVGNEHDGQTLWVWDSLREVQVISLQLYLRVDYDYEGEAGARRAILRVYDESLSGEIMETEAAAGSDDFLADMDDSQPF